MDPMDFTMDEQHSNPSRCNYPHSQPHPSSSSNNFTPSQPHNAHHYDPVHNTDSWFSQAIRPQYTAPQNISQYGPGQHLPINNWQGFGAEGRSGRLGDSMYRQPSGYMGSQWNSDLRGFGENMPFTQQYNPYGMTPGNNVLASPAPIDSGATRNPMVPTPSASVPPAQPAQSMNTRRHFDDTATERHRQAFAMAVSPTMNGLSETSRHYDLSSRTAQENRRNALQAQISSVSRSHEFAQSYAQNYASHRRRMPQASDSDDDDDSSLDMEQALGRAGRMYAPDRTEREDEIIFQAAVRGQIAAAKKIPSKEALASLERLAIKDLDEASKSCIICYNDFGVPNPEGLIELPTRLPKCKHIFGDNCIKKWFEDSDTCPYCRDKLPSERVVPKASFASREAYHRYRERAAGLIASQAAIQQSRRLATGGNYPTRFASSDELANPGNYNRHSRPQEQENPYPVRQDSDLWSLSPSSSRATQRDSPERRRQQARGRASLGRPTSVGSARYNNPSASYQNSFQRGNFQGVNTNTNGTGSMTHRPASPGFIRQNSDRSNDSTTNHRSSIQNRLSGERLGSSSPEASPPVAVGTGVASVDRSTTSQVRFGAFPNHLWLDHDQLGGSLAQSDTNNFFAAGRTNDFARAMSFDSRAGTSQNNENTQASSSFADLGLGGPLHSPTGLNRR